MTTNTGGGQTASRTYYAYGSTRTSSGTLQTDRTYTGQKSDGTGLLYYNARYYDPALGTFLSPDTLVPDPGAVIDYNRFLYARGNPVRYSDPTGHYIYENKPDDPFVWYGDKPAKGLVRTAEPVYIPSETRDTSPVTAISVGLGANADAMMIGPLGFSGTGGIEVLAHKDGEVAVYTYGGGGATVGVNAKVYVSRVRGLPDADSYQGVFEATDGTASVGVGFSVGRFSAPLEKDDTHGEFFGFAPGANLSASETVVNYTLPWLKFDSTTGDLSSPLLDDLRKKLRGESPK